MFIDQVKISAQGGNGGNGIVAFRREKFVAMGGPSGGSGGRGGDIIFVVDPGLRTLLDFSFNKKYQANNGENGMSKGMHGAAADDLILKVPPGTVIYNDETDEVIADLVDYEEQHIVVKGGRGGRGNAELARAGRHSLEISENGEPGQLLNLRLELKLLADVGLVGFPSVGKSTIISVISKAKPKIAAYHFTTLVPKLGVTKTTDGRSFVVADLPGLIEGAHLGKGLGHQFLRHIQRTKVLLHVIDMSGIEGRNPIEDYEIIRNELISYDYNLEKRAELIVANKMDMESSNENLIEFKKVYPDLEVIEISALTKTGLEMLLIKTADLLDQETDEEEVVQEEYSKLYKYQPETKFEIFKDEDNVYNVTGAAVERLVQMTNFGTYDNTRRFANQLRTMGVDDELRRMGIEVGEIVRIEGIEFEFQD
ncbi:MAG: GTPase ObgE [Mycoplasmatales bacterium]